MFLHTKPVSLSIPHFSKKRQYWPFDATPPQSKVYLAVALARNAPNSVSWWLILSELALVTPISTTISPPQRNLPKSTESKVTPKYSASYYKSQQSIYHYYFSSLFIQIFLQLRKQKHFLLMYSCLSTALTSVWHITGAQWIFAEFE